MNSLKVMESQFPNERHQLGVSFPHLTLPDTR